VGEESVSSRESTENSKGKLQLVIRTQHVWDYDVLTNEHFNGQLLRTRLVKIPLTQRFMQPSVLLAKELIW
jgi:hypothetical protein